MYQLRKVSLFTMLLIVVAAVPLFAFTPASGNQTIYSGTTWFTDTGGWPGGPYQNGENYTLTLYPASAGYAVTLDMWDFTTEAGYDYLRIYNGPSTGYTQLANWHGTLASIGGRQTITSTASDGTLTIWWYTDGSVVFDGWAAYVSIVQVSPSAPSMYNATNVSSTAFTANWSYVSGATNYYLEIATNASFSPNTWEAWVGNTNYYTYTSAAIGTTYYLRVRAYNGYWSGYSNTQQVTTLPATPTAYAASGITSSGFRANWSSSSGASVYFVDLSTNSGFSSYDTNNAGASTYYDFSNLTGFTDYYYRVRAYNAGGYSGYSQTIQSKTLVANPNPVTATPSTIYTGQSSNLNGISANCNIRWFTSPTGGTALGSSASGANFNVSPSSTTTYYAEGYSGSTSTSSLSNILSSFNSNYGSIISTIPNRYDFAMDGLGGVNATNIYDGGNDMYDGGNYLATNFQYSPTISYSDNNVISSAAFGSGGMYFTRYVPGLFILVADMNNVQYFQITGNNGADGGGSVNGTVLSLTVNGIAYSAYLKRVYSAGDPSINQMILIPQNSSASHWWDTNTDSSGQHLTNIQATTRLYYLLYAGGSGYYIDDSAATNIATAFLQHANVASTEQVSSSRTAVTVNVQGIPSAAAVNSPENASTDVPVSQGLNWYAPATGGLPTEYRVFFGTDNPPATLVQTISAPGLSFDPGPLQYDTQYFWQIVPYNPAGPAPDCPVWNYTTTDIFVENELDPVVPDPEQPENTVNPTVQIPGVTGEFDPDISTGWNPPEQPFGDVGLYISISNAPLSGRTVIIDPGLGFIPTGLAYRLNDAVSWIQVLRELDWRADYVYFTVPAGKADDDLEIIFPQAEDETLPVSLSSFTATLSATQFVVLNWVTQSQTDHYGYNVLRNTSTDLTSAYRINPDIITSGVQSGSQISYSFLDSEVDPGYMYYYWLQDISLMGLVDYHGPVSILVDTNNGPDHPVIPMFTELLSAYPNPFNPSAEIKYCLADAREVQIDIYNMRGQKVRSFNNYHSKSGFYSVIWNGDDNEGKPLSSGTYIYRMRAGNVIQSKRITLLK